MGHRGPRRQLSGFVAVAVALALVMAACSSSSKPSVAPSPKAPEKKALTEREREAHGAGRTGLPFTPPKPGEKVRGRTLTSAVKHDKSPQPLRNMKGVRGPKSGKDEGKVRDEILPHPKGSGKDPIVQPKRVNAPTTATVPTSFNGIGAAGYAPPDTNMAVGPTAILQNVNVKIAVYNKSGATVMAEKFTNAVFSGFGGPCETTNNGDGIVRYDRQAGRWLISQFAWTNLSAGPWYECVAISTTGDPTGSYYRYAFQYGAFPDYPKFGVWPDAYYVTYNMFTAASSFAGGAACALDRTRMLSGLSATQVCFSTSTSYGAPLPADVDGTTQPPAGSPNPMVTLGLTSTSLAYWNFHVDFATPGNSTFTGPISLPVAAYTPVCGGNTCIPQPAGGTALDSLADRVMNRLAYRNVAGHQSLVMTHSVVAGGSGGVRWYEFRLSGGVLSVFQQSTWAPDSNFRWMGSAAMNTAGDIAMGYSVSSTSTMPSLRVTGRLAADPVNTMTQGEPSVIAGTGVQNGGLSRWGDYATVEVDPADDCTFWFTSEYIAATGSFNWSTRIASVSLAACTASGPTLTVTSAGTGTGVVTSNPAGISCPSTCSKLYALNTPVTLTATPDLGQTFAGWSGSGCAGTGTCSVTMSAARAVTATFSCTVPTDPNATSTGCAKVGPNP
ncbi:MAG: hypothetical protein JWM05_1525 [Acidimicrobiales bacterium]|nr:hypothetical protein [Acidimicrobiales bacterium]